MMENLLSNKKLLRSFLKQCDLLNTINGGIVATRSELLRTENCLVIRISAPSVSLPAYNIFLEKRELIISSVLLDKSIEHTQSFMELPLFSKRFNIPLEVDLDKIEAIYENDELRILLPFNQILYNQLRKIQIKQV